MNLYEEIPQYNRIHSNLTNQYSTSLVFKQPKPCRRSFIDNNAISFSSLLCRVGYLQSITIFTVTETFTEQQYQYMRLIDVIQIRILVISRWRSRRRWRRSCRIIIIIILVSNINMCIDLIIRRHGIKQTHDPIVPRIGK